MEHTGLEPVASTLPVWRAPNCANAPKIFNNFQYYFIIKMQKSNRKIQIFSCSPAIEFTNLFARIRPVLVRVMI